MTLKWYSGRRIRGLSSDTKPSLVEADQEFTETDTGKVFHWSGSSWSQRRNESSISTTTTTIDFTGDQFQTYSLDGNVTLTTSNKSTGRSKTIRILNSSGSTDRTITVPTWRWVGTNPTSSNVIELVAAKYAIITLTCFGTTDADILAAYAVEE